MVRWVASIAIAAALAGCMTAEERYAADDQQCQSYGFKPGTEGYAQCRMNLDLRRRQAAANIARGIGNAAAAYGNPTPPVVQQPAQQINPEPVLVPGCGDGYACAGRTLQGDGRYH
jgi:hypothetical protein